MEESKLFEPLRLDGKQLLYQDAPNKRRSPLNIFRRKLKANRPALFGLAILLLLLIMAIIGPALSPYTYYQTHLPLKNQPPSLTFWFGTDELGRDLFVRCWWGARISLFVGLAASLIDVIIGIFYGSIAGLLGGKVDEGLMRLTDILYCIPHLLIVIAFMAAIGPGLPTIIFALTFTGWANMARIVRGQIIHLKQQDFITASKALGASPYRILYRYLLPNAFGPIIATLSLTIPAAIFTEAFLSFLGLGVQAPAASLGAMANDGLTALRYYPWRLFFPAALISLTILSFNLVGESVRDILDYK